MYLPTRRSKRNGRFSAHSNFQFIKLFKMDTSTKIHTSQVNLIDIEINAKTKEEVLKTISAEFDKYPHLHRFLGRFSGAMKSEPIEKVDENVKELRDVFHQ